MKKLFAVAAITVPLFTLAPASAHHPAEEMVAEGILSAEIYDMIESNLEGTPHLELDFTTIGSMAVLSVTVPGDYEDDVLEIIGDALAGMQRENDEDDPEGEGISSMQRRSEAFYFESESDETGLVTITISEHIGKGESQTVP